MIYVTGVDADGHSCVTREEELTLEARGQGLGTAEIYRLAHAPRSRPEGPAHLVDLGVGPGGVNWGVVSFDPGREASVHHTDTVDFDLVLDGSIELLLDTTTVELRPGDAVVVTGVDHGWRAGPDGARMSVLSLGTPPL